MAHDNRMTHGCEVSRILKESSEKDDKLEWERTISHQMVSGEIGEQKDEPELLDSMEEPIELVSKFSEGLARRRNLSPSKRLTNGWKMDKEPLKHKPKRVN